MTILSLVSIITKYGREIISRKRRQTTSFYISYAAPLFRKNRRFLAGLSPEELRQAASIFTKVAIDPLSSTERTIQLAELVAYTTLLSEGKKIPSPDLTVEQIKAMYEIASKQIILQEG